MPIRDPFAADQSAHGRSEIRSQFDAHRARLDLISSHGRFNTQGTMNQRSAGDKSNVFSGKTMFNHAQHSHRLLMNRQREQRDAQRCHEAVLEALRRKIESYPSINDRRGNRFDARAHPVCLKRPSANKDGRSAYFICDPFSSKVLKRSAYDSAQLIQPQIERHENNPNARRPASAAAMSSQRSNTRTITSSSSSSSSRPSTSMSHHPRMASTLPASRMASTLPAPRSQARPLPVIAASDNGSQKKHFSYAKTFPSEAWVQQLPAERQSRVMDELSHRSLSDFTGSRDFTDEIAESDFDDEKISDDDEEDSDDDEGYDSKQTTKDPYRRLFQTVLALLVSQRIVREAGVNALLKRVVEINSHLDAERLKDVCEGIKMEWATLNLSTSSQQQRTEQVDEESSEESEEDEEIKL